MPLQMLLPYVVIDGKPQGHMLMPNAFGWQMLLPHLSCYYTVLDGEPQKWMFSPKLIKWQMILSYLLCDRW